MRNPLLAPELRELLEEGRADDLRSLIEDLHPNDAASIISGLENEEMVKVMALLPTQVERDVFLYLDPDVQQDFVLGSGRQRVKQLLAALPSDARHDLLDRLDPRVRDSLLPLLEKAQREDLIRREQYRDDQVGSLLSTEFCALRPEATVVEAIADIRRQEPTRETIYYAYVVDGAGKLIGCLTLRDLITAPDRARVKDLMKTDVVSVPTDADQEEAANKIKEYDILAVPAVDKDGRLVGIVTYDDAVDILEEESTEDVERMAGVTGETEAESYLDESVWSQIRRRGPSVWLFATFYLLTAAVIDHFAATLSSGAVAAFMPLIMATGGAVSVQSGSLVIRGLTLGTLAPSAIPSVLWKEARVSLGLAGVLSAIVFAEGHFLGESGPTLTRACTAMALAMAANTVITPLIGALIPMLARAIRRDPALVLPAVTALTDLAGASIYLLTIHTVLGALE
jgi:magnesium transporter